MPSISMKFSSEFKLNVSILHPFIEIIERESSFPSGCHDSANVLKGSELILVLIPPFKESMNKWGLSFPPSSLGYTTLSPLGDNLPPEIDSFSLVICLGRLFKSDDKTYN